MMALCWQLPRNYCEFCRLVVRGVGKSVVGIVACTIPTEFARLSHVCDQPQIEGGHHFLFFDRGEYDCVVATGVEIAGLPVWDLTAPYMLHSTGTDSQGRLDGTTAWQMLESLWTARLGDDAQSWVPVSPAIQTNGIHWLSAYSNLYCGYRWGVLYPENLGGVGQNSTLNLSVDVTVVTLVAIGDIEAVPVGTGVATVAQAVNAVDVNGVIDGDYAGTLVVQHDADGSVGLPVLSTVTVVVIEDSFIAGISTSVLRVEVEADMPGNQLAVISLLLGARDSLG